MTKTLKDFLEVYRPKSPDEQKFVDKHVVIKHKDRNGNGDDVFKATNVKTSKRKEERHGYDVGEDEKVYESVCAYDKSGKMVGRYKDMVTAKKLKPGHRYEIQEALKGNQHKIDANKNGKVDAHDFKLLRSKKKVAEEAEGLDEISKKLATSFLDKTEPKNDFISGGEGKQGHEKGRKLAFSKLARHSQAKVPANEEVILDDLLDEALDLLNSIDEKTLTPAEMKKREEVVKAIKRGNPEMDKSMAYAIATKTAKRVAEGTMPTADEPTEDNKRTAQKVRDLLSKEKGKWASKSYKTADGRWASKDVKEEADQIDEISTKLATNYTAAASDASKHKALSTAKLDKRYGSMALAYEKIRARHAQVPTTEAVGDITVKPKSSADAYAQHTGQMTKKSSTPKDPKTGKTLYQKMTSEEVEDLDEGLMHDRYIRSHGKKARGTGSWAFTTKSSGSPKENQMHFSSGQKSLSDAHKEAAAKLGTKHLYVMEEVELDEGEGIVTPKKGMSYATRSSDAYRKYAKENPHMLAKKTNEEAEDDGWYTHSQMYGSKKSEKHPKGISAAEWKSGIRWHHGQNKRINIKEEVDELDETSKAKLGRYINKAKDSIDMTSYRQGVKDTSYKTAMTPNPLEKKLTKRHKGIEMAVKKLTKEDIIDRTIEKYVPEEVKFTPIERFIKRLDGLSESHVITLVGLFEQLNNDNQLKMIETVETREGINQVLNFALENRGE